MRYVKEQNEQAGSGAVSNGLKPVRVPSDVVQGGLTGFSSDKRYEPSLMAFMGDKTVDTSKVAQKILGKHVVSEMNKMRKNGMGAIS